MAEIRALEAIELLNEKIDRRLEAASDELSRIGDEIRHIATTFREVLSADVADQSSEVVTCTSCDAVIDSVSAAVRAGWKELLSDPDGLTWSFLGECPDCHAEPLFESEPSDADIEEINNGSAKPEPSAGEALPNPPSPAGQKPAKQTKLF